MEFNDLTTGNVGKPMTGLEIRLVDWEEGNYRVTDRPNPRGEIIVAGDPVAKGYLNPDGSNVETFFEEAGKKWFRTGDIGEFDQHGKLIFWPESKQGSNKIVHKKVIIISNIYLLKKEQ